MRGVARRLRTRVRWRAIAVLVATAVLTLVVATAATATFATAPAAAQSTDDDQCATTVEHDALRTDDGLIDRVSAGEAVTTRRDLTRVTYTPTDAFYRLEAENPNGYCVHVVVEIGERALPPADLPTDVTSNDGSTTATWQSKHDFDAGQTYTHIAFDVAANSTVEFAPSRVQVVSVAWAGEKQQKAEGVVERLRREVDEPTLRQRKYQFQVRSTPAARTVPLTTPNESKRIDDYQAQWTTDGSTWHPVTTRTDDPVYKSEPESGDQVTFHWTEPARVRFTANPTPLDEVRYQVSSYRAGVADLVDVGDLSPFGGDES
jgi:hypothetical protein